MKQETDKTFKQKVNEFLCKYAQPEYRDEYGNIIHKSDGKAYKCGKVTGADVLWNLIVAPLLLIFLISFLVSILGDTIGKDILTHFGISINIYWLIDPLIRGLILVCGALFITIVVYFSLKQINKILSAEVAKCPLVEIPPERRKCVRCGAPLPYENEEIKVTVKYPKYERMSLGDCEICKAPKLYENEKYAVDIISYQKANPKKDKI
jgi:hypothetical protein